MTPHLQYIYVKQFVCGGMDLRIKMINSLQFKFAYFSLKYMYREEHEKAALYPSYTFTILSLYGAIYFTAFAEYKYINLI